MFKRYKNLAWLEKALRTSGLLMVTPNQYFPFNAIAHVKRSMIDKWSQPWFLGFTWTLKSQTQGLKVLME